MSVVSYQRIESKLTGKVGESLRLTETYQIRVDNPDTSRVEIIQATPIGWYTAHWEFPECKAMEFDLSHTDRSMMMWHLSVTFYIPPKDKKFDCDSLPCDYWEAAGGVETVPVFQDIDGFTITNSAGDPLEGLSREREEKTWTLTKFYADDSWMTDREVQSGRVNATEWGGGDPHTWKCMFKSATKREAQKIGQGSGSGGDDGEMFEYVETKWEFRYDPETWKCLPWDIGFMELNGSGEKRTITTDDGKAVKQPVALNPDGTAKEPGEPPSVINNGAGMMIYRTSAQFAAVFGEPEIVPGS